MNNFSSMSLHRVKSEPQESIVPVRGNRRVPLDGAPNFRDIGGYPAFKGKRTRWGQIFRSGHLANLAPQDQARLRQIGIRHVIDFRSKQEVSKQPDRLPFDQPAGYSHMPIVNKTMEPTMAVARIRKGDISWFDESFVIQSYIQKVEDFAHVWLIFFNHLFRKENRPLVFHCTAGKDRTGAAAALILLSLGVPEETVIEDYLLSNTYNAPFIDKIRQELADIGIDPEKLLDYIVAPLKAITALIEHLAATYGSAWDYLVHKAGIDESRLIKFRHEMLE